MPSPSPAYDYYNNEDARLAAKHQHDLTVRQALRLYPQAIFWSCVLSLVIVMDGYDTALIGSLFGFPAFQRRFGVEVHPASSSSTTAAAYQVEAKWQTALGLASPLGGAVGLFLNGVLTERFGHKRTLLASMTWLTACILLTVLAPSVEVLLAGELLCGVSWGIFTTMGPAYASEVAPLVLRAYLQTFVVLCWGIGQLVSYGVLDGLTANADPHSDWTWRIPFAVQWVWPALILPLAVWAPESPWWLVRRGRLADAERAVRRLMSSRTLTIPDAAVQVRQAVALMVRTTDLERRLTHGARYADCFRGENLWRTEIGCVTSLSQVLAGFAITTYAGYFFQQAGLSPADAYKLTVGQGALHFVVVVLSVLLTARHGRRPIFITGALFMAATMLVIGCVAAGAGPSPATGYASATVYLVWFVAYELTLAPIVFVIVGEVSSTRLRSKSIALARVAYNLTSVASFCVAPYVLNPTEGDWKGKAAFLPAAFGLLVALWAYFRLPECKGRTYEEIDILFARRLRTRDFSGYKMEVAGEPSGGRETVERRE